MITTILMTIGIYTVARLILVIAAIAIGRVCAPELSTRLIIEMCDKSTARNEETKAHCVAFRTKRGWQS